jgi:GT2 family glycosyltransferase
LEQLTTPKLAVVVVTYNSAACVGSLLRSLPAGMGDVAAEVVVVDNNSSDDTVAMIRRDHPGVRLVSQPNVGYAGGINRGVAETTAEFIMVLNPDMVVEPDSLAALVAATGRVPRAILTPLVLTMDRRLTSSLRREPVIRRSLGLSRLGLSRLGEAVTEPEAYSHATTADWAEGSAMLFSRRCFQELGGWDESYFLFSEETDFCLRAKEHGYPTVLTPTAAVRHAGGGSGRNATTEVMLQVNRVRCYRRHHRAPMAAAFYAVTVARHAAGVLRQKEHARQVLRALLVPASRPAQVYASGSLIPR